MYDLQKIEHTYAPPFSSAKDPIAIAGYVAGNIISGAMPVVTWRQISEADRTDTLFLDVRTREEFTFGAIPGAVNIPLDELRGRIDELPHDKDIYIYCAIGLRGYLALKILMGHGFNRVRNLLAWRLQNLCYGDCADSEHNGSCGHLLHDRRGYPACGRAGQNGANRRLRVAVPRAGYEDQAGDRFDLGGRTDRNGRTNAGFSRDAQAWCNTTGNRLVYKSEDKGKYTVVIEKGSSDTCTVLAAGGGRAKTLIMFSDDLDKALATFVLANGAATTGQKVSIFFTFWGLNVIKKTAKPKVKKDIFGRMFGMMLPSSSLKLRLSKMSMLGIGDRMMRHIMKNKGIDSLESLRQQAIDSGVEFIACQMSMDVMGVKREELLDDVTVGGVATYMERAEEANVNLFI